MKLLPSIGVTLAVAAGAYLTSVNALHPYQGIRLLPASLMEVCLTVALTIAATLVCIMRLRAGSQPHDELERFFGTKDGSEDLS